MKFVSISLSFVLSAGIIAASPAAANTDEDLPPLQTFEPGMSEFGEGAWEAGSSTSIAYMQKISSNLTIPLMSIKCDWNYLKFTVTGFEPMQQFPQPFVETQLAGESHSARPSARYTAASVFELTHVPEGLEWEGPNRTMMGPNHGAHATIEYFVKSPPEELPAIMASDAITVQFAGQERRFPAIPDEVAAQLIEGCGTTSQERVQSSARLQSMLSNLARPAPEE